MLRSFFLLVPLSHLAPEPDLAVSGSEEEFARGRSLVVRLPIKDGAFGLPGRGKTHLICAIGHEMIHRGHSVLFTAAYNLVQRLLTAKKAVELEREMRRLDRFEAVIIDDIGYVQQRPESVWICTTCD